MRLERPGVSPASVRHGSWRAAILVCLLAGRGWCGHERPVGGPGRGRGRGRAGPL